ncbi:aminotransferase class I/II-fold pyridoxal phosphate-dependent enzyme [Streptomyces erythrochromogenes]|uniref:type I polyketide synthase n=1 Tax=Streptomyces sp. gCLA4 TaxID=1873416 RepID=UPI001602EA18|nr:type I polyketide synthase [Streptomyces sp. gCLA4]MBZ9599919.1 aminotransferase class I/II-fold pyridoxal phosphate-dependent enzyme [Streptomyces erythrochromogenes]
MTDIAIVGLGCRFPGAHDIRAYWKLLMSGERQFSAVPEQRWNHDVFHDPGDPSAPHAAYTDQVAFLDDVDRFDALHYGMPPARARATDPQHRLMLDVTREALDDAGLGRGDFDRENTGVFCAMSVSDYKDVMTAPIRAIALADRARRSATGDADADGVLDAVREYAGGLGTVQPFSLPGSLLNMAAGTVSRQFDLGGPSFAVDAACSGSLVALDQAVAQLRQGCCRIAVVGGVYVNLTPDSLIGFSTLRALSATGVCRPFDEEADGFVLGEGAGAVVIRPLADALAAGDRVYAVIKGVGSANDGASPGPLAPAPEGQLRALRRAYRDAGLPPSSVSFLEAHGTATRAGDRAEIEALRRLRTEYPDDDPSLCYLGAGKALIGHSLAAAGMAGLIKTALVVHHRTIVPQPRTAPHPDLGVGAAGLRFAETVRPWPRTDAPRRAAVSSFGFGGTNVHVVLEEAPVPTPAPAPAPGRPVTAGGAQGTRGTAQVVLLSAGSAELLDLHIGEVLDAVERAPRTPVAALAHTLGGREPLRARLAIVAADTQEFARLLLRARRRLAEGARGDLGEGAFAADAPLPAAQRRIAFVFPGQGSQRPGMMRDLYERFAGFRTAADALGAVVRREVGFDPAALLYGGAVPADGHGGSAEELGRRLTGTEVCQPLLGTVQIAATRLLADCGVAPDLTLGHSVGEFAAAAAAGALTGEETVRLLAHRGAALRRAGNGPRGGMIAVQSDPETCRRLAAGTDDVWLACFNHPRQVVLSGTPQGLAHVRRVCADAGIATVALEVSDAFHSPLLACAEEAVRADLAGRRVSPPRLAFVSSVSGAPCTDPEELRELWVRHASAPVRFGDAVRASYDTGARLFLQVSGGASLLDPVRRNLADREDVHVVAATGTTPDGGRDFVRALARLAVLGVPVDPRVLVPAEDARPVDLPVARLAGQPYWAGRTAPPKAAPPPPDPSHAAPADADPSHACPSKADPAQTLQARPAAPGEVPVDSPVVRPMDDLRQLVRDQAELMSRCPGASRAPAGEEPAPADAADADADAADADAADAVVEVTESVFAQIARISAFPVDHLRPEQLLTDDLGFDSLMLTDLFTALRRQWPQWTFDEHDAERPTVGGVAAAVAGVARLTAEPAPGPVPEQRAGGDEPPPPPPAADPPADPGAPTPRPEEHTRIDRFPEVTAHAERVGALVGTGLSNPYFLVHEGGLTDTTVIGGREFISFSGYNYLGLATHPRVSEAAKEAIDTYGTSVSASRLLSGSRPLHSELEAELARLLGCEASVTLANGHATNVTVIGHLVGPGDLVVHDALAHDSILQGCRLSGATRRPFPHNDAAALDALLGQVRHQYRRVLVVIEGVYSMDGDMADLPALVAVKQRHGALLMVDEAHSIGTTGATGGGVGEHFGVDRRDVDLWSGTLSKALASCGGYVAASSPVVEYLRYTAPGFVYSAGMTPADTAACLASLRLLCDEPERVARLAENAALFVRLAREADVDTGDSHGTPVVPCIVGDSLKALRLAQALLRRGVSVNPILHPAVPEEMARLRFFVTRDHTPGQIRHTVTALAQELRRLDPVAAA